MPYTVYRPAGVTDNQFTDYARLLSQSGFDLGRLRRVPDPATNKRWLPVWDTHAEAQEFADTLLERTGPPAWDVVEVHDRLSEGPLGPILIQYVRMGTELVFALPGLTQDLLRSAFPGVVPPLTTAGIAWDTLAEYKRQRGNFAHLMTEIVPVLTGLTLDQLNVLGYSVAESAGTETTLAVPPQMVEIAQDKPHESGRLLPNGAVAPAVLTG